MSRNYVVVKDSDPSSIAVEWQFRSYAKRYGRESGQVTVSIEPMTNIVSVGPAVNYNLNVLEDQAGEISYALNPAIQFGDEIKYILKTDNGLWVKKDTIVKTFGAITLRFMMMRVTPTIGLGIGAHEYPYVSPNRSFADSPNGNYVNNQTKNFLQ